MFELAEAVATVSTGCAAMLAVGLLAMAGRVGGMGGDAGSEPKCEVFADEYLHNAWKGFFGCYTTGQPCLVLLGCGWASGFLTSALTPGLASRREGLTRARVLWN